MTDPEIEVRCLDCGLSYSEFGLDATLPDRQWLMIHPGRDGLLCLNCIAKRAAKLSNVIAIRVELDIQEARR